MVPWRWRDVVVLFTLLTHCKLVELATLPTPGCRTHEECDAHNRTEGIGPGDPRPWRCDIRQSPSVCSRIDYEIHDGSDNNGDGVIDEGMWWFRDSLDIVATIRETARRPSIVQNRGTAPALLYTTMERLSEEVPDEGRAYFINLEGTNRSPRRLRYQTRDPEGLPSDFALDPCPVYVRNESDAWLERGVCQFREVVAGAVMSDQWFVASINPSGCARGQLRIGYSRPRSPDAPRPLEISYLSNLAAGVAVQRPPLVGQPLPSQGACTSPPQSESFGAAGVSIAALGGASSRALVVWQTSGSETNSAPECGAAARTVNTLGVIRYSNGAVYGTSPRALGVTDGRGSPAVVAYDGGQNEAQRGFFEAHGDSEHLGHVAVRFLTFGTPENHDEASGVQMEVISLPLSANLSGDQDFVDQVALAVSPPTGSGSEAHVLVGVVWKVGCRARGRLWFAQARFLLGARMWDNTPVRPVRMDEEGNASTPSIIFASTPFVTPQNHPMASLLERGGWVVSWVEMTPNEFFWLRARRVLAADGQPLELGMILPRNDTSTVFEGPLYQALYSTEDGRGVGYVIHNQSARGGDVWSGELLCDPATGTAPSPRARRCEP